MLYFASPPPPLLPPTLCPHFLASLPHSSRPVISLLCGPGRQPWQVNSDLGYPIDPEGLNLVGWCGHTVCPTHHTLVRTVSALWHLCQRFLLIVFLQVAAPHFTHHAVQLAVLGRSLNWSPAAVAA